MWSENLRNKIDGCIESQQEEIKRINSTNIGVENLFSESWLLGDLKLLQEKITDNELFTGMLINVMCAHNPRLFSTLYA